MSDVDYVYNPESISAPRRAERIRRLLLRLRPPRRARRPQLTLGVLDARERGDGLVCSDQRICVLYCVLYPWFGQQIIFKILLTAYRAMRSKPGIV